MNLPDNINLDLHITALREQWGRWCEAYQLRDQEGREWYEQAMKWLDSYDKARDERNEAKALLSEVRALAAGNKTCCGTCSKILARLSDNE